MDTIYDAKLLIVDDNAELLALLCEQLRGAGYPWLICSAADRRRPWRHGSIWAEQPLWSKSNGLAAGKIKNVNLLGVSAQKSPHRKSCFGFIRNRSCPNPCHES